MYLIYYKFGFNEIKSRLRDRILKYSAKEIYFSFRRNILRDVITIFFQTGMESFGLICCCISKSIF